MAFTRGRCTNFDYCSIAESRRDVEVRVGEDFICPECGKALKAPELKGGGKSPVLPALLGVGVLALVGGAVFLGMRMGSAGGPADHAPMQSGTMGSPQAAPPPAHAQAVPAPSPPSTQAGGPTAAQPTHIAPVAPVPTETVLFKLHGAGDLAASVMAPLASSYLAQIGDTAVSTTSGPDGMQVGGLRGGTRETIAILPDTTEAGFKALARGAADLVMVPRRILPAEQTTLAALGEMTGTAAEHVLAWNAKAVVVNPGNQVASLSREQVRDILGGTIRDWGSVGAASAPIVVYAAPQGDEDEAVGLPAMSADTRKKPDDPDVARSVAADPQGVGLVDVAQAGQARIVPIAETGATPVSPQNDAAVVADDYPLAYRLFLYTSPKAFSGFAQHFVEYAVSPQGQAVVEHQGLISATLTHAAVAAGPATETDKLRAFVAGAKRLAIVFRFQPNSTALDEHGEVDLDRVINYLVSLHEGGEHLLLAGFADNQGDSAANLAVSKKRADAVAALFVARGLKPGGVASFGAELPVADNSTEEGRERNRRVEVYIKK
jgi:phosphate transport system substrate-binding protein